FRSRDDDRDVRARRARFPAVDAAGVGAVGRRDAVAPGDVGGRAADREQRGNREDEGLLFHGGYLRAREPITRRRASRVRDLHHTRPSWQPARVTVLPLLFAAHGGRARSWADVVRRSRGLELLAAIDLCAGGVEGLDAALAARPDAAVLVWARGPLEASALA